MTKPQTKAGYTPEELSAVRSTLLHLASVAVLLTAIRPTDD